MARTAHALEKAIEIGNTSHIIELGRQLAQEVKNEVGSQAEAGGWYEEYDRAMPDHVITKDMVRAGIEQGVIRFEANPDPNDPWKTMCCVSEDGGLFYFVDTTDIPPAEYIRMNQNNLDMVVDDVWESLNDDILRDFADDYERYAVILREPHHGGRSSLDAALLDPANRIAVGVGYVFNLIEAETAARMGIALRESGTVVTVDGKDYPVMKGRTYEDARQIDRLLDACGEKRIADFERRSGTPALSEVSAQSRAASATLSGLQADSPRLLNNER